MTRTTSSSGLVVVLFVLVITFSLISASVAVTPFLMPTMQMSFAKKSGTVKDGSGGDSGLGSGSKGDSSPKARVSHDPFNVIPACGGYPGHPPTPTKPTPTPQGSPPDTPPVTCVDCNPPPIPQGGLTSVQLTNLSARIAQL
jgi:hypothetical protein